jgi:E3 ubiquitin-protein ligase HUWE1
LLSLEYAIDGEDLGGPPVFVQAPRPIGEQLDGGNRILGNIPFEQNILVIANHVKVDLFVEGRGPAGHEFATLDATIPFETLPDEFGRAGHRRTFRAPHIIRTSMLQEMLGGPTAQMLQDMARTQNGDIHLAFSGPAAQLLLHETGFVPAQLRHRMASRYMSIRPGRSPGSRDGGLGSSVSTTHRWSEEGRVNAGPSFDERLGELANHVVLSLLPAAREAAKIAEEKAKQEREAKEAEEKAKAEKEALERAEAEEKAQREAEELERQRAAENAPTPTADEPMAEAGQEPSDNADQNAAPPPSSTEASPPAESTSTERPRVTVMYRGQSVDITDADIDPEFLNAVPEEIRDEIIGNFVREQQRQSRPSRAPEADIDMDFFNALPPDLREDVLRGQAIAHFTGAVDMDAASVLATLPEDLRQTVLLEQDDAILETMPSSVLAEANALRASRMARRTVSVTPSGSHLNPPMLHVTRRQISREAAQLLDRSGLAHLLRLLFYVDQTRRGTLQQVLVNLSENNKSRTDLLNLLLGLLNVGKTDLASIDKSFSQLSVRRHRSNSKGKQREDLDTPGSLGDRAPDDHVVIQRTLDTLTAIVHANESASLYFLTEQDSPSGLHRIPSKKGKGKEKQQIGTYYPFVQLLSLLERPNMVQQSHTLDAIAGLLYTVTKPLAILREPVKPPQQTTEPTTSSTADTNPNPATTASEEISGGTTQQTTAENEDQTQTTTGGYCY